MERDETNDAMVPVIIAGGGIGGLLLALTCHEIGVPVRVLESVTEMRPFGVGINLQPNAVRELECLGLADRLGDIGVETAGVKMYSRHGGLIWGEPRGREAGYNWPQYSVHRGELQMLLYDAAIDRLGADAICTGARVTGFDNVDDGVDVHVENGTGETRIERGRLLIGADGVHSAIRAQMYPHEGPPLWSGRVLWRGTTRARPYLDGRTMVFSGNDSTKIVSYPISSVDPASGDATINWIAERTFETTQHVNPADYSRTVDPDEFLPAFADWTFAWHEDIKALVRGADRIYEYPMVDRDPLPRWTDGNVTLMGDAAHVMYPVGSNGASQAIVDARKIGRAFLDHGVSANALETYEAEMRPKTETMVLTNRRAGPDHVMEMVEQKCGGVFDEIHDVISQQELEDFASKYKKTAGFAIAELNASEPMIPSGATVAEFRNPAIG